MQSLQGTVQAAMMSLAFSASLSHFLKATVPPLPAFPRRCPGSPGCCCCPPAGSAPWERCARGLGARSWMQTLSGCRTSAAVF